MTRTAIEAMRAWMAETGYGGLCRHDGSIESSDDGAQCDECAEALVNAVLRLAQERIEDLEAALRHLANEASLCAFKLRAVAYPASSEPSAVQATIAAAQHAVDVLAGNHK